MFLKVPNATRAFEIDESTLWLGANSGLRRPDSRVDWKISQCGIQMDQTYNDSCFNSRLHRESINWCALSKEPNNFELVQVPPFFPSGKPQHPDRSLLEDELTLEAKILNDCWYMVIDSLAPWASNSFQRLKLSNVLCWFPPLSPEQELSLDQSAQELPAPTKC